MRRESLSLLLLLLCYITLVIFYILYMYSFLSSFHFTIAQLLQSIIIYEYGRKSIRSCTQLSCIYK